MPQIKHLARASWISVPLKSPLYLGWQIPSIYSPEGNKVPPFFCPKINSFSFKANFLLFRRRGWQTFSVKGQRVNIISFADFANQLFLPLQHKSNYRQYVTTWTWLCSNNTVFTKTDSQIDCGDGFTEVYSSPNSSLLCSLRCIH